MNVSAALTQLAAGALLLCAPAALAQAPAAPAGQTPPPEAAPRARVTRRGPVEPNLPAPELYSETLAIRLTLVDLPGAADPRSTWEGSYQLYFVSEAEMRGVQEEVLRRRGSESGGVRTVAWNPTPADFPGRILLAEGSISQKSLATPALRTHAREDVPFRAKVPAAARTKGAHLLLAYSVKVYDARLKVPAYKSGIFTSYPFDDDAGAGQARPRAALYAKFRVSPEGDVWTSKLPHREGDTNWP